MNTISKLKLHTLLGNYPHVATLKRGELHSNLIEFDFADVKVANTAFKPLVREARFDLGELAIVTFLQAKTYGKPYALIPATVVGRGQLHTIFYNAERGSLTPADLPGKKVGVRAYTQTTGAWVRGILNEDYGVDPNRVTWVTFEDPHLAEYRDPPNVERAAEGKSLQQMLIDGEIDAAIGNVEPSARIKPLFPDADAIDRNWAERCGGVPINHMLVIRDEIAKRHPQVVTEVYRLFKQSKAASATTKEPALDSLRSLDPLRFGIEANRKSLEKIIDYAFQQKLIPRRFAVDELFDEQMRAL
jgi:4,5-dihydroxyphthalate decarboxylase